MTKTHQGSSRQEYRAWAAMRQRCRPYGRWKHWYFDRGITVCERWSDFPTFLADVGAKPSPRHTLDRIDNDKSYEPGNVRWATWEEQQSNRPDNVRLTVDGRTMTAAEWSRETGINYWCLIARVSKSGWDHKRAVTTPLGPARRGRRSVEAT